jgi:hypothetical protein
MAKAKRTTVTKAKTARKATAARRRPAARADRCRPLRDQAKELRQEIAKVRQDLAEPDIPNDVRVQLQRLLRELTATHARVLKALEACEKIPANPVR